MEPEHTNLADVWGAQQRHTAAQIDALSIVPMQQQRAAPPTLSLERAYGACLTHHEADKWQEPTEDESDDAGWDSQEEEGARRDSDDEPSSGDYHGKRRRARPSNPRPRQRQGYDDVFERGECFFCAWGDKFHDGIEAPHINKLFAIIDDMLGIASDVEIADAVVDYYQKAVYDAQQGMPRMTRFLVLHHLHNHTKDARLYLVKRLEEGQQLMYLFKQAIVRADGSFDYKAHDAYWKAVAATNGLYKMRLEQMNFNNGKTRDDTRLMSNPMQLMRSLTQRRAPVAHHDDVFGMQRR